MSVRWLVSATLLGIFSAPGFLAFAADLQLAQADGAATPKKKEEKVKAEAHLSVDRLPPGQECRILIRLTIQPGWHINTNPARPEANVATEVTFKGKHGTRLTGLKYPSGKEFRLQDLDEPLWGYEGKVDLFGTLSVPAGAAGMTEEMDIVVKYQACDDRNCLLPTTVKLSGKLPVAKAGEPVRAINDKIFKATGT